MNPNEAASQPGPVKVASAISFLLGVWFFVSPWVYGAYMHPSSWNNWIFGVVIAVLASIRFYNPAGLRIFSWVKHGHWDLGVLLALGAQLHGKYGQVR